ncbi:MAG: NINE protein, partial [Eubacterium sp.]|nr:NINE protein [Eubacterium sp.]
MFEQEIKTKFCKYCGSKIQEDAIVCTACGRQVEQINQNTVVQPNIIINNDNINTNTNTVFTGMRRPKNKWVAFCLCLFLGVLGAHKFYEGKTGLGILYICTGGLCGIG